MAIFKEVEISLRTGGIGPGQNIPIFGTKIRRTYIRSVIISSLLLCSALELTICVKGAATQLIAILFTPCGLLTFVSATLIYTGLMVKSSEISELFKYLENAITTSKPI